MVLNNYNFYCIIHYFCSGASVTEEEINMAESKFEESKSLAETAMYNLMENDVS